MAMYKTAEERVARFMPDSGIINATRQVIVELLTAHEAEILAMVQPIQPMFEAPKDGTSILLYFLTDGRLQACSGCWCATTDSWVLDCPDGFFFEEAPVGWGLLPELVVSDDSLRLEADGAYVADDSPRPYPWPADASRDWEGRN